MRFVKALALLSACIVKGLDAQTSLPRASTHGLMVGAQLEGSALVFGDNNPHVSRGGGATVGYGPKRYLMLYGSIDSGDMLIGASGLGRTYSMHHYDIGVRFMRVRDHNPLVPYLNVAVTERRARASYDATDDTAEPFEGLGRYHVVQQYGGPAITGGTGVQYFVDSHFAVDAGFQLTAGRLNNTDHNSSFPSTLQGNLSTTSRLSIGIRVYNLFDVGSK